MSEFFTSFGGYLLDQQGVMAFLVAMAGVGVAALSLLGWAAVAFGVLFVLVFLGWAADGLGQRRVTTNPLGALRLMEAGVLAPTAVAVGAGAMVIFAGITLEPPTGATPQTKALLGASAAAISSVLSVMFIKGVADPDGSWLADRIQTAYQEGLQEILPGDQQSASPIYSEPFGTVSGWGRKARTKRVREAARMIAATQADSADKSAMGSPR